MSHQTTFDTIINWNLFKSKQRMQEIITVLIKLEPPEILHQDAKPVPLKSHSQM